MATILVVEDDEELRKMLQFMLQREGHTVIVSPNGLDALYQASYYRPDLVVLDLMMPWAAGDAVLGFIRCTEGLKHTPVLVISAHPDGASLARQHEADGFIGKPVDMAVFFKCVDTLLARAQV